MITDGDFFSCRVQTQKHGTELIKTNIHLISTPLFKSRVSGNQVKVKERNQ